MHPIDHIRKFTRLTPELEETLHGLMRQGTFRKGAVVRGAINFQTYAYYIQEGAARMFVVHGGKEHTLSFIFEDQFAVPSLQALNLSPDTIALQFLENTKVIYVPHLKVKDILEESDKVDSMPALLFLNAALIRYSSMIEERLYMMQTLSAPERYRWLMDKYPRLQEIATITQIASFLGLTKETLYRIRNNRY